MDTKYAVVHTAEAHTALETFVEEDIPVAAPVLVASAAPPSNQKGSEPYTDDEISITWEKGEAQPAAFRDKWFAIAFVVQFVAVLTTAMVVGATLFSSAESEESDSATSNNDYGGDDGVSQEQAAPGIAFWVSIIGISVLPASFTFE